MLDAIDAGLDQFGHRLFLEAVGGHPGTEFVGPVDGRFGDVGGPQRCQVAAVTINPVPHQLDPAVAPLDLFLEGGDQVVRVDLSGEVANVALGTGNVATGSDHPGQVVALIDPVGVGRGTGVAHQQRAGISISECLAFSFVRPYGASMVQADVAVGIDQPGNDPAVAGDGDGVGDRLGANDALADPQVTLPALGQHHPSQVQRAVEVGLVTVGVGVRHSPMAVGVEQRRALAAQVRWMVMRVPHGLIQPKRRAVLSGGPCSAG